MGLFEKIFKKSPMVQSKQYFKLLDGYTPVYTSYNGGLYEMMQTKAIINTIATDCGKAIPTITMHNKKIEYILQHQPNEWMSTSAFLERCVTSLLCDNNLFIIPILDEFDRVTGVFPITYSQVEALEYKGKLYLQYTFTNGQKGIIEYSKVGHCRRMQYKNDLYGDTNGAINQTLEIIHAQNEASQNILKQNGVVRFMGQLNEQLISKEDFEEERKLFTQTNLTSSNGGMMIFDSRYKDIKQVEAKAIYLDETQQKLIDDNLKNYFGVSTNVIQHKFTNDYEWNSYYEGVIEPLLLKIAEALTKIFYTENQIMNGNCVYMTTNRLQYMSNESKLAFSSQMFDRGIINGNDVCDVWNLPHYDGGEKHYIRKEYAEISKLDDNVEQIEVPTNES
jgi:HK97 family phage portal protein